MTYYDRQWIYSFSRYLPISRHVRKSRGQNNVIDIRKNNFNLTYYVYAKSKNLSVSPGF